MDISATKSKSSRRPLLAFMLSNLVYLLLVQIWGVKLGPISQDAFVLMHQQLPWPSALLLRWEVATFDNYYMAYHAVNLVLLYGCMIATLLFVRTTLQSVWWLGSLASVLLMANPLKDEAVLTLTGGTVLLPVFMTLVGLACYAQHCQTGGAASYLFSLSLIWFLQWTYPALLPLSGLIVLYEWIVNPPERRYWIRMLPFVFVGAIAIMHWGFLLNPGGVRGILFSLVLVLYPIGYLPDTLHTLDTSICYRVAILLFGVLIVLGVGRKLRSRGYWFAIAGAIFWMALWPDITKGAGHALDLEMLIPIVLVNLAFAALCGRMQTHPRWTRAVVTLTTLMCLIFFAVQIQSIRDWYSDPDTKAARQVLPY